MNPNAESMGSKAAVRAMQAMAACRIMPTPHLLLMTQRALMGNACSAVGLTLC